MMSSVLGLVSCDHQEQTWTLKGKVIEAVAIDLVGEKFIDEDRLKDIIRSASGDTYSADVVDSDIRALYESGYVEDVRVFAEPEDGGVRLIFKVTTRPGMGPAFCIGNTAFSDKKLAEASGLTKERPITITELENARKMLKTFYVSSGYLDAEVGCRAFQGGDPSPEDYLFVIDEGATVPQPSTEDKEAQQDAPSNGG